MVRDLELIVERDLVKVIFTIFWKEVKMVIVMFPRVNLIVKKKKLGRLNMNLPPHGITYFLKLVQPICRGPKKVITKVNAQEVKAIM